MSTIEWGAYGERVDEGRGSRSPIGTVCTGTPIVSISANTRFGREPDVSLLGGFVAEATEQAWRSC